jgi:hypothetical protein
MGPSKRGTVFTLKKRFSRAYGFDSLKQAF